MEGKKSFKILYFTGTGNTDWVVKQIDKALKDKDCKCDILAVDELQADCGRSFGISPDWNLIKERLEQFVFDNDILILAFPTYGSDVPIPLKEILGLLPENKNRLAVISTVAMDGGDAVLLPIKMLEKKGYNSFLTAYVKMPNNIKVPGFDFFDIKNGESLNSFYESAGKTILKIVEKLLKEEKYIEGEGIGQYLMGETQRFGESLLGHYIYDNFFATAKCTKCQLCAASCPMGNITFENGYPEFGKDCCLCLRCYNFCPVNAIQISTKTFNEKKYTRYKGFDNWKPKPIRKINK